MADCRSKGVAKVKHLNDLALAFDIIFSKPVDKNANLILAFRYAMQKWIVGMAILDYVPDTFRDTLKNPLIIEDELVKQINQSEDFKAGIVSAQRRWIAANPVNKRLMGIGGDRRENEGLVTKPVNVLEQKGVSAAENNRSSKIKAEEFIKKQQHDQQIKELRDYATTIGSSQKWGYYREYYRGPTAIAHDDDYEGSGDISFADVALTLCKNKEEIDKLFMAKVGSRIEDVKGHYRTIYTRIS